jgi:S1-C subfamily serine protease
LPAELASAVFVVDAEAEEPLLPRPRLGVFIESDDDGVRVVEVVAGSVADKTGLAKGDLIRSAAGFAIETTTALVEIIQRQAPGTWLPLTVLRGDESLELFARFPQSFE